MDIHVTTMPRWCGVMHLIVALVLDVCFVCGVGSSIDVRQVFRTSIGHRWSGFYTYQGQRVNCHLATTAVDTKIHATFYDDSGAEFAVRGTLDSGMVDVTFRAANPLQVPSKFASADWALPGSVQEGGVAPDQLTYTFSGVSSPEEFEYFSMEFTPPPPTPEPEPEIEDEVVADNSSTTLHPRILLLLTRVVMIELLQLARFL